MSHPQQRQSSGFENVLFPLFVALISIGTLLWISGEIAGLLSSGRLPGASVSDMGRVVVRLADHLEDPARAWPRGARRLLPGPILFYVVLCSLAAAAVALGWSAWQFLRVSNQGRRAPGSGWASLSDLRPLIVRAPEQSRLVLGRVGSRLIAAEQRQSVIVLGPTQSMKTTGFAIPSILEWNGPVLATSVKTDLLRDTLNSRARRGQVWIFDPTGCSGVEGDGWSPLHFCQDWRGAQRTAGWLAGATRGGGSGLADSEFWYAAAAKLLAPLLFAAASSGRTIGDVVRWVNTQDDSEVNDALAKAGVAEAIDAATASFKRESRQKSSVFTTAETVLAAYEDPDVAQSATRLEITPERLIHSTGTLYVVAPSHEQRRLRPLYETLLQSVITYAFETASRTGRPLGPPLLVVLDEAANIAPLRDLDSLASTAAAHGIQLVSVFQDLAQITTRYGERAQTVVNNHRAKIVLSGISDTQTLEYASRLLGDEEVLRSSVTRGSQGAHSTTESPSLQTLAPAHVLRAIRPGEGVLVYGHLPPARLRLRPWFREKHLRVA